MFGRNKGDSINLDDPGKVTMDSAYYKELIAAKNELVVLRNEKEDWLEDRAGVIEKQNDLNAEIERLQEENRKFRGVFTAPPEPRKRTWKVTYGWGKYRDEAIVTANRYLLSSNDTYEFWNEVSTGRAYISLSTKSLTWQTDAVVVAEFSDVISVVELSVVELTE